jgi:hypothetical protein
MLTIVRIIHDEHILILTATAFCFLLLFSCPQRFVSPSSDPGAGIPASPWRQPAGWKGTPSDSISPDCQEP